MFVAATFETDPRRRMTRRDWLDAGLAIGLTVAVVAVAYLIVLIWH